MSEWYIKVDRYAERRRKELSTYLATYPPTFLLPNHSSLLSLCLLFGKLGDNGMNAIGRESPTSFHTFIQDVAGSDLGGR